MWVTRDLLPEKDSATRREGLTDFGTSEFVDLTIWTSAPQSIIVVGLGSVVAALMAGGGFGGGLWGGGLSLSENPGGLIEWRSIVGLLGLVPLLRGPEFVVDQANGLHGFWVGGGREGNSRGRGEENQLGGNGTAEDYRRGLVENGRVNVLKSGTPEGLAEVGGAVVVPRLAVEPVGEVGVE